MRDGDDHVVGLDDLTGAEGDSDRSTPFHQDAVDAGLEADTRAALGEPARQSLAVKRIERHGRNLD